MVRTAGEHSRPRLRLSLSQRSTELPVRSDTSKRCCRAVHAERCSSVSGRCGTGPEECAVLDPKPDVRRAAHVARRIGAEHEKAGLASIRKASDTPRRKNRARGALAPEAQQLEIGEHAKRRQVANLAG